MGTICDTNDTHHAALASHWEHIPLFAKVRSRHIDSVSTRSQLPPICSFEPPAIRTGWNCRATRLRVRFSRGWWNGPAASLPHCNFHYLQVLLSFPSQQQQHPPLLLLLFVFLRYVFISFVALFFLFVLICFFPSKKGQFRTHFSLGFSDLKGSTGFYGLEACERRSGFICGLGTCRWCFFLLHCS